MKSFQCKGVGKKITTIENKGENPELRRAKNKNVKIDQNKAKIRKKSFAKRGGEQSITSDIRKYFIEGGNKKVEAGGPILPLKKGQNIRTVQKNLQKLSAGEVGVDRKSLGTQK